MYSGSARKYLLVTFRRLSGKFTFRQTYASTHGEEAHCCHSSEACALKISDLRMGKLAHSENAQRRQFLLTSTSEVQAGNVGHEIGCLLKKERRRNNSVMRQKTKTIVPHWKDN